MIENNIFFLQITSWPAVVAQIFVMRATIIQDLLNLSAFIILIVYLLS